MPAEPRYEIVRRIAEGAVAEVFLARAPTIPGDVVLKVLRPTLTTDPDIVGRFLDESKLCQQLSHPNIIKHLGAGKLPDGRVFMATELLEGEDLASRIRTEGPLTPGELVRVILPICEALDYVHQRQVIHRDVKPANVFLSGGLIAYAPKLIDFGLALFQGNKSVKTAMGVIVATPEYTPPECINGQKADARSDLYALGVLMFEALTGSPPFVASSYPELLLKHLNEPPPELPEQAHFLSPIVSRCLAKNPQDRFPTAGALAQALRECTSGAVGSTHVSSGVRTSGIRFGDESPLMGSYQPIKLIGEGAMGRVYLARHTKLGRQVALKVLRSEHAHNPQLVQRFIQEAQTVNQINHEHIVEIFDFIETGSERDRRVAFVMELLTGAPLTDVLRAEAMPVVRAVGLVRQVCSALEAAHKVGVVHRDVKPDNIFITQRSGVRDFVKVLDFGVAKLVRPLSDSPTVGTMEGVIIGTPTYMAPEQASGKPADARVDIYALGVVLYEMLVGAPPFDGEVFGQLVVKIVTEPPPPIPDKTPSGEPIPEGLKALIMRCLAKTPGGRPQTMTEFADALRPFESGDASAVPASSRRWGWMVAGVVLALGLGGGGWFYFDTTQRQPPPPLPVEAPPPPVAVAPPPPPAAPAKVSLTVHSFPTGARVIRTDTGDVLGVTPLDVELMPSDAPIHLKVELAGYESIERDLVLKKDRDEDFSMIPKRSAETRRAGPPKKEKVSRDGVIDPFH